MCLRTCMCARPLVWACVRVFSACLRVCSCMLSCVNAFVCVCVSV